MLRDAFPLSYTQSSFELRAFFFLRPLKGVENSIEMVDKSFFFHGKKLIALKRANNFYKFLKSIFEVLFLTFLNFCSITNEL